MVTPIFGATDFANREAIFENMSSSTGYMVPWTTLQSNSQAGAMGGIVAGARATENTVPHVGHFGHYSVCADITLYNADELSGLLNLKPPVNLQGDTGLLAASFLQWGHKCVHHLKGDFAFAILDNRSGELFCARDHMGVRPFFYSCRDGGFAFASELRMVKGAFGSKWKMAKGYFLDTLLSTIPEKDETAFEGLFRLPPGHFLLYREKEVAVSCYWALEVGEPITFRRVEDYTDYFRELLVNSIQQRCHRVQHAGAELSGGLDSTAVTCIAFKKISEEGAPLTAFSNVLPIDSTPMPFNDERKYILKTVKSLSIPWAPVDDTAISIPDNIDFTVDTQGAYIMQRFSMLNYSLFQQAMDRRVDVLFSGFGGDELVSARTSVPWMEMIAEGRYLELSRALRYGFPFLAGFLKGVYKCHIYTNRLPVNKRTRGVYTDVLLRARLDNNPLQRQFKADNSLWERFVYKHERQSAQTVNERLLIKINHPHVPQRMEYSYAQAARFGLQYRYPLLDPELLRAFLSYPPWVKQRDGKNRYLFRQALRGIIPEEVRKRNDKTGIVIPHSYTRLIKDREAIVAFLRQHCDNPFLAEIFDFDAYPAHLNAVIAREKQQLNSLMPGVFYNHLMVISFFSKHPWAQW